MNFWSFIVGIVFTLVVQWISIIPFNRRHRVVRAQGFKRVQRFDRSSESTKQKMKRKNPFQGIACSNGSNYGLQFFRHVEGPRDTRPSSKHLRFESEPPPPFRDAVSHPMSFLE